MEILGLLDTLESMLLDGTKIPLTKKVLVDEEKLLSIIDKMRLVLQGGEGLAKEAIAAKSARTKTEASPEQSEEAPGKTHDESKAVEILQQAYQMAKEIREGADRYADEVLAGLEAASTRVLRTIKAGRDRLAKTTNVAGENK